MTPPTLDSYALNSSNMVEVIYVPTGTSDLYKAAENWSDFADIIVEKEM